MKIIFLNLLLAGSIVISVMLSGYKKDDNTPSNGDDPSTGEKGTFKDNRDGKTYKWVKIGKQVWMAENLNYTGSGTHITDDDEWPKNSNYDGWCYYENNENYSNTYGVLYQWEAAKIACPVGWHLPTDEEWTQLENYLKENGFSYDGVVGGKGIAKSLAADSGWSISDEPGAVGNSDFPAFRNKTGFSALPGGARGDNSGVFHFAGTSGGWWSATEANSTSAWIRFMDYYTGGADLNRNSSLKSDGFSVRCVRD